jgi:hypothetical protein
MEGITAKVMVIAESVGIADSENRLFDDLFPSSILKIEHEGR